MNRFAWIAAALAATAFLAALALTGGRGGPELAPFTPAGLLNIPAEQVREAEVTSGHGQWHFVRGEGGWRAERGKATSGFEARLEGAITFISPRAEFTPRNVQTAQERSRLVYRIKVTVDNHDGVLKSGMPVEAELPQ